MKRLLLAFLSSVLSLALLEGSLRFIHLRPEVGLPKSAHIYDAHLGNRLKPGFEGVNHGPAGPIRVKINSAGFRSKWETHFIKPFLVTRVAMLGDSFVSGFEVNVDDTFSNLIQNRLFYERYEILNMGTPGYGTEQEIRYLKEYGALFKPDVVVLFFYVGNDVMQNEFELPETIGREKASLASLETVKLFHNLARDFAFKTGLKKLNPGTLQYDAMISFDVRMVRGYVKTYFLLEKFKKLCHEIGAKPVVVLLPFKNQIVDKDWREIEKFGEFYDRFLPQKILNPMLERSGMAYLDLLPRMLEQKNKDDFFFKKDPHLTEAGHEFVASQITESLLKPNQ